MKATGIVRRIDELGRLVIPKEIRRVMRMDVGSAVEIFTQNDQVVLQKYSPIKEFKGFASSLSEGLEKNIEARVVICDESEWLNGKFERKMVANDVMNWVSDAKEKEGSSFQLTEEKEMEEPFCFVPVKLDGRGVGGILAYGKASFDEGDKKALRASAEFLSRYLTI